MDIPATTAVGLSGTGQAISRSQARFDASAQQVTADAQALADPAASDGSSAGLASDLVAMQSDAISNRILYAVFQRQQELQGELANLIQPAP